MHADLHCDRGLLLTCAPCTAGAAGPSSSAAADTPPRQEQPWDKPGLPAYAGQGHFVYVLDVVDGELNQGQQSWLQGRIIRRCGDSILLQWEGELPPCFHHSAAL